MPGFEVTRVVDAEIDRVFEIFTDLEGSLTRCKGIIGIELETTGPVGKGTIFKETRQVFSRESTETLEFTEFQPPSHWVISGVSCGAQFTSRFDLQPEGGGTRVIVTIHVKPLNPFAWLMSLLAPLLNGTMKRAINEDMDTLSSIADGTWTEPEPEPEPEQEVEAEDAPSSD
ncbi:MAG: SRPBCC family protein [Phycisphaerales bacterium]|nr:SRPBCC family protein [Phycisphaerales bacterium]